jgi:branched-chain amino acid transport system substrate-binding protein
MKRASLMQRALLLAAVGLIVVSFFGNASRVMAAEPDPINIGVSQDFSGVTAQEGLQEHPAVEIALKEINAAGGINGRPIKLFVLDNAGDPTKTVGTLKVLKEQNKCVAIYYGINSVGGIACKAWCDKNKIPAVAAAPISDKMWQREGKAWFFRTQGTNSENGKGMLLQAKRMGFKKVGLHVTTQAFGTDMERVVKENCAEYGLEVVGSVRCEPESKDLTIQATRLRSMKPDVVINQNYPADVIVWARALKTIGWKAPMMNGALITKICLGLSPVELYEDWIVEMVYNPDKPAAKEGWRKYEAHTGKTIEGDLTIRGYDTLYILAEAIRLGGNPDSPEAIRDGFYKIKDFPMLTGQVGTTCSYEIGRNHAITAEDMVFGVVKAGKIEVLPGK